MPIIETTSISWREGNYVTICKRYDGRLPFPRHFPTNFYGGMEVIAIGLFGRACEKREEASLTGQRVVAAGVWLKSDPSAEKYVLVSWPWNSVWTSSGVPSENKSNLEVIVRIERSDRISGSGTTNWWSNQIPGPRPGEIETVSNRESIFRTTSGCPRFKCFLRHSVLSYCWHGDMKISYHSFSPRIEQTVAAAHHPGTRRPGRKRLTDHLLIFRSLWFLRIVSRPVKSHTRNRCSLRRTWDENVEGIVARNDRIQNCASGNKWMQVNTA